MKRKRIILIGMLFMLLNNTFADELRIADFCIKPSSIQIVDVLLDNPDQQYIMLEFWMKLPEGVVVDKDEDGQLLYEENSTRFNPSHQLVVSEENENTYHFLLYSNKNEPLNGTSGKLFSITIITSEDVTIGIHQGRIYNQIFCSVDKNEYKPKNVAFNVTVEKPLLEQTLTFEGLPALTYGDEPYQLPTQTNQGLPLTWKLITDMTVARIEGYKLVIIGAGTATIMASQEGNEDYEFFSIDYILTVEKAPLTIIAEDCSKYYGDENPELIASYDGFVFDEDESVLVVKPVLRTTATKESNAGTYPITIGGAEAANYFISYESGTLTINKRDLIVSTNDYTRYYNVENPEFELIYDGFVGNEDENVLLLKPTATTLATKDSDVGVYDITIDGGQAVNYELTYKGGKLTIEKAYQTLTWEQDLSELKLFDQVELSAEASSELRVNYYIAGPEICSLTQIGEKTYLDCSNEGETVIYAIQEGNNNYWQTTKSYKTVKIIRPIPTSNNASDGWINTPFGENVYDLQGRKIGADMFETSPYKRGINIIRMSDGTTRKVVVK